jgi:hypothetical protein
MATSMNANGIDLVMHAACLAPFLKGQGCISFYDRTVADRQHELDWSGLKTTKFS